MCIRDRCTSSQRVEDNAGVACAPGTTNDAGDDALRGDTTCEVTKCAVDQRVQDNACVTCPAGTSNADGGDDASGEDTACSATKCGVDEYVSSNACTACAGGSKNADGGDDASGDDTTHAFETTRSFAVHAHVVSSPDASSPSCLVDPPKQAAHAFEKTYSSTPHFVAEHEVSSPEASSPPSALDVPAGHVTHSLSCTR